MIGELQPYPEMKDSGVPWLGQVPAHWDVRRLKYLIKEVDDRTPDGSEQLLRVSQYTGVTERRRADGGDEPDTRAASLVGYKRVRPDDLVVNIMLAWNGSMGVSRFDGIASPAYCVYRFRCDQVPWYFHHLLRSPQYKARIKSLSTGVVESRLRLYTDELYRLEAILPPVDEQDAIVRFLGHVDRRIRRYIRAKQKLIKLLEEQKQAIIQQAVTRGLDPEVPLKPSGIPWLGDIPEHWDVRRIATFSPKITNGWVGPTRDILRDSGVPYIQSLHVKHGRIRFQKRYFVDERWLASKPKICLRQGDVVVVQTGDIGQVACIPATFDGAGCHALIVIRTDGEFVRGRFLDLALRSKYGFDCLKSIQTGALHPHLNCTWVREVFVPVPPVDEQAAILSATDTATAAVEAAIQRAENSIELVREIWTRLIADVVTGKLDIRKAAASLPVEDRSLSDDADAAGDDLSDDGLADEAEQEAIPDEAEVTE